MAEDTFMKSFMATAPERQSNRAGAAAGIGQLGAGIGQGIAGGVQGFLSARAQVAQQQIAEQRMQQTQFQLELQQAENARRAEETAMQQAYYNGELDIRMKREQVRAMEAANKAAEHTLDLQIEADKAAKEGLESQGKYRRAFAEGGKVYRMVKKGTGQGYERVELSKEESNRFMREEFRGIQKDRVAIQKPTQTYPEWKEEYSPTPPPPTNGGISGADADRMEGNPPPLTPDSVWAEQESAVKQWLELEADEFPKIRAQMKKDPKTAKALTFEAEVLRQQLLQDPGAAGQAASRSGFGQFLTFMAREMEGYFTEPKEVGK